MNDELQGQKRPEGSKKSSREVVMKRVIKEIAVYFNEAVAEAKAHKQRTGVPISTTALKRKMLVHLPSINRNHYFFNLFIYCAFYGYISDITLDLETGFVNAKKD